MATLLGPILRLFFFIAVKHDFCLQEDTKQICNPRQPNTVFFFFCQVTKHKNKRKRCGITILEWGKLGDALPLVPISDPEISFCFAVARSSSVKAITCIHTTLALTQNLSNKKMHIHVISNTIRTNQRHSNLESQCEHLK